MGIYLKVPGVNGLVHTQNYQGWIQLNSCQFGGVSNPTQMTVGKDGDRYITYPFFEQIVLHKNMDISSISLFEAVSTGKVFPQIEIVYVTTGNPVMVYAKTILHHATFTHYQESNGNGGLPEEILSVAYTKIERTYIPRDEHNAIQSPATTGYDLPKGQKM